MHASSKSINESTIKLRIVSRTAERRRGQQKRRSARTASSERAISGREEEGTAACMHAGVRLCARLCSLACARQDDDDDGKANTGKTRHATDTNARTHTPYKTHRTRHTGERRTHQICTPTPHARTHARTHARGLLAEGEIVDEAAAVEEVLAKIARSRELILYRYFGGGLIIITGGLVVVVHGGDRGGRREEELDRHLHVRARDGRLEHDAVGPRP